MTCLDKLKEQCPDYEMLLAFIMENNCPDDFNIMDDPDNCDPFTEACDKCWAREIPGTEPANASGISAMEGVEIGQVVANCLSKGLSGEDIPKDSPAAKAIHNVAEAVRKAAIAGGMIKDSGDRTRFESGAVRDMREGKGRCDLMPLLVVGEWLKDDILGCIAQFQRQGTTVFLYGALNYFVQKHGWGAHDQGEANCTALLEVAKHFEEGAKKYGENNWQKGIPVHCYIDSAVRHYLKWLRGDEDEPHDRAFVWNLMCCIWEVDYREKEKKTLNYNPVQKAYDLLVGFVHHNKTTNLEEVLGYLGEALEGDKTDDIVSLLLPTTKAPEMVRLGDLHAGLFEYGSDAYLKVVGLYAPDCYLDVLTGVVRELHPDILVTPLEIWKVDEELIGEKEETE